jgi:quercetin dioxygenase-like cupin family protein
MPLRIVRFAEDQATEVREFSSRGALAVELAHGAADSHVYAIHMCAGGEIGPHPAGFDQLFLVVQGSGWVAGAEGSRHTLSVFEGVLIPSGEIHSKGSECGLVALMVQAGRLSPAQSFDSGPTAPAAA